MKSYNRFLPLLLAAIICCAFFSCRHKVQPQLLQVDNLLREYNVIEAETCLRRFAKENTHQNLADSMFFKMLSYDVALRGRTAIEASAADTQGMHQVADYYLKHGSADEKLRACCIMAQLLKQCNRLKTAEIWALRGLREADTTRNDVDAQKVARLYGVLCDINADHCSKICYMELAGRAISWSKRANDSIALADNLIALAETEEELGLIDSGMTHCKAALHIYRATQLTEDQAYAHLLQASFHLKKGEPEKAQRHIAHCEALEGKDGQAGDSTRFMYADTYHYVKSQLFILENLLDSAIGHSYRLIGVENDMYRIGACMNLANCYERMGMKDSTMKYLRRVIKDKTETAREQIGLQIQEERADSHLAQEVAMRHKLRQEWTLAVAGLVIALLLIGMAIMVARFKIRLLRTKLEEKGKAFTQMAEERKNLSELLDLLKKYAGLTGASFDCTDEKAIEKAIEQLEHRNEDFENALTDAELGQMRMVHLQRTQMAMSLFEKSRKGLPADAEELDSLFDEVKNAASPITDGLLRAHIGKADRDLCILIVCGFRPKEICNLLGCSKSKISMRTRLAAKLFDGREFADTQSFDETLRSMRHRSNKE